MHRSFTTSWSEIFFWLRRRKRGVYVLGESALGLVRWCRSSWTISTRPVMQAAANGVTNCPRGRRGCQYRMDCPRDGSWGSSQWGWKWMKVEQCEIFFLVIHGKLDLLFFFEQQCYVYTALCYIEVDTSELSSSPKAQHGARWEGFLQSSSLGLTEQRVSVLEGQCICYFCCLLGWKLRYLAAFRILREIRTIKPSNITSEWNRSPAQDIYDLDTIICEDELLSDF